MSRKHWVFLAACLSAVACSPDSDTGKNGGSRSSTGGTGGTGGTSGSGGTGGTAGFAGTTSTAGSAGVSGASGTGVFSGGACKAGHYLGQFEGMYRSAAWGNGEDVFALMVSSIDDPVAMTVGLEFWLEESGVVCEPSEEFCGGYTINGGKMRGNANAFGLAVPFDIDLTGDLDCKTGEFRGQLSNGQYVVFGTATYNFAGDINAQYDSSTSSFVSGTWDVVEEPMQGAVWPPGANIGGEGTWGASWVDDSAAPTSP